MQICISTLKNKMKNLKKLDERGEMRLFSAFVFVSIISRSVKWNVQIEPVCIID
jgi:hypothetical protein